MEYKYDKDKIKEELTIEQVCELLGELGGDPYIKNNVIISRTICHDGDSHKLYYYDNTHLFRCYTECDSTWDIYELLQKIKEISLFEAIDLVARRFGFAPEIETFEDGVVSELADWKILAKYDEALSPSEKQIVVLKILDENILKYLPHPRILPWENEGITQEVMQKAHIAYDPVLQGIVIPHYNIDGELVGIRERTLIKEEEAYGKYKPAILNGVMYNHPLGFNLYNINNSKENIKIIKKVIIFEGEKSCLKYASFFGIDNDISCACCGSSLLTYQIDLLLSLGVQEIIIGFDKQFKEIGDAEFKKWTKKLEDFFYKYHNKVQISFLFDKQNLLGYKDSPLDRGKEIFLQLFQDRVFLGG